MRYKVRVAGKIFQGSDTRALIRLAVAARREARKQPVDSLHSGGEPASIPALRQPALQ